MNLGAGRRLGAYEILSPIGVGGMGEVYRARDTRLGRDVAIKVLRAERIADESRRRRFVQEARAASALNHPNIVTIHEIESHDGLDFIVMEYLPGKTLDGLMRPRMRLADVLRIAIPIADALARAHAAGIVHRDLTPANVIVTPDGVVKILDFGLAKLMALDEKGYDGETMTEERFVSGPGTIAGTPGYMSPEQATGGKVDARSDVFAFGSLLYEMVTGRRAFAGGSRAETLAAVTRDQPTPLDEIVAEAPRDLEKLILRCLRKEPGKRFQYMADVKVELEEIREDSDSGPAAPTAAARPRGRLPWKPTAALAGVLIGGVGLWLFLRSSPPPSPRVVPLTATQGIEEWPTLSPDGKQVAFSWEGENDAEGETPNSDIWLRIIGSSQARRLTTDAARDSFPSWSPDGRQIAFLRSRAGHASATIHVVSPLGGDDQRVGDFPAGLSQLAWSPDGRWLAARRARQPGETTPEGGGIHAIPFPNGEPRAITAPKRPGYDAHPAFSPDGRRLAYASCAIDLVPPCDVVVVDVGGDLVPKPPPRRLARESGQVWGLAWTRDGDTLVYSTAQAQREKSRLWRVRTSGDSPPERLELAPQGSFAPATVASQDRLAFAVDRTDADIYRFEAGQPAKAVLASPSFDTYPSFSPDGRKITFQSGRSAGAESDIWLADADGSNPLQLTHGPGAFQSVPRFSPDGRRIAFNSHGEDGFAHVWLIDTAGGSLRRLTHSPFHDSQPIWSRDGQWIYYREDRADGRDIVRISPVGGSRVRVTHDGALLARLSADGRTLFYTHREGSSPLSSLTLPDGPARRVVDCVLSRSLADGPDGIYYLGCPLDQNEVPLYRLDPASGRSRLLGKLNLGYRGTRGAQGGLAVSPDGRTVLFPRLVTRISDLMMIESFR